MFEEKKILTSRKVDKFRIIPKIMLLTKKQEADHIDIKHK